MIIINNYADDDDYNARLIMNFIIIINFNSKKFLFFSQQSVDHVMKQTDPVYGQTNANVVWDGQVMIVNNVNNIRIVNTVIVMYQWNVFVKKDGVAYFAIKVKIQKKKK